MKLKANREDNARLAQEQKEEAGRAAKEEAAEASRLQDEADIKKLLKTTPEEKQGTTMDDMTPSQMLDIIGDAVDKTTTAQNAQFAKALKAAGAQTGKEMKAVKDVVTQVIAKLNVDAVRGKYKDFDEMTPKVRSLMDEVVGLPVDYAYILAKGLDAGKNPPAKKVETERPDTSMSRMNTDEREEESSMSKADRAAARKESEQKAMSSSRSGRSFRQMAEDAYDKVKASQASED